MPILDLKSYDLSQPLNFSVAVIILSSIVIVRYFLINQIFYYFFYQRKSDLRLIYDRLPSKAEMRFEIKWSIISCFVFGIVATILLWLFQNNFTKIYFDINEYGVTYFVLSIVIMLLLHDLYFYITHRLMHLPFLYRKLHHYHHKSLRPSPWASFSFSPSESLIESLPIFLFFLFLPLHIYAALTYLIIMTISATVNHLGYEIIPQNKIGRALITGTNHAAHHKYFNANYGLYFTYLDRLFKTEKI